MFLLTAIINTKFLIIGQGTIAVAQDTPATLSGWAVWPDWPSSRRLPGLRHPPCHHAGKTDRRTRRFQGGVIPIRVPRSKPLNRIPKGANAAGVLKGRLADEKEAAFGLSWTRVVGLS